MVKKNYLYKIFGIAILVAILMMIFAPLCVDSNTQAVVAEDQTQVVTSTDVYLADSDSEWTTDDEDYNSIVEGFRTFCMVLLIVIPVGGTLYAISIGINMAKADGDDKRRELKKRLVNAIIGLILVFALMFVLFLYLDNYQVIMDGLQELFGTQSTSQPQ